MTAFQPYHIHHLQLGELDRFYPPTQNSYLVFWHHKIPLGHLWIEGESLNVTLHEFRKMIAQSISPALQYYIDLNKSGDQEWASALQEENYNGLSEFLETNHIFNDDFFTPNKEALTVIVCTRNRPQALQRCLEALMRSRDANFELVVVDNAPDDTATEMVVRRFPVVRYVKQEMPGLDKARNKGIQAAQHPIIAFTDDDVEVTENWIENLKTSFKDQKTLAITGLVICQELKTPAQYEFEKFWSFNKGYIPATFDHAFFLNHTKLGVPVWETIGAGANMAFRKKAFEILGLFDERLGAGAAGCSDDSEFWYRVLAEGWNCQYFPHLVVLHQHRETKNALDGQIYQYMKGLVCSLLIQHEKYHYRGELFRLYQELPKYYWRRIKKRIKGERKNFNTIGLEIRGCIAGWFYYYRHPKKSTQSPLLSVASPGTDDLQGANADRGA